MVALVHIGIVLCEPVADILEIAIHDRSTETSCVADVGHFRPVRVRDRIEATHCLSAWIIIHEADFAFHVDLVFLFGSLSRCISHGIPQC